MTVFISADMEGISGVVDPEHVTYGNPEYERFRRLMTAEVNAAVEGACEGGADRLIVNDAHGRMSNILIEEIDGRAELVTGKPKLLGMMQGIELGADAAFFVGYHAASGSASAVLEHTNNERVFELSINGRRVGELGFNAALAGHFGAPVALVTGDSALAGEAKALLSEVETVVVKEAVGRTAARCLAPGVARKRIREAAKRCLAVSRQPMSIEAPIRLAVVFTRASYAQIASLIPGTLLTDGRRVESELPDVESAYMAYRAMLALAASV